MENLRIFDVRERFPCVVRRLITCPSNTPLGIGGIIDVMSDYLVDNIFIRVFHYDVQWYDICGGVIERFEMSDVGNHSNMTSFLTNRFTLIRHDNSRPIILCQFNWTDFVALVFQEILVHG